MNKITPFLWFDNQAEEAVQHYTSIFKNCRVTGEQRYGEGSPAPAGTVMTMNFELDGQEFIALNGGPHFKFTEAVSFFVRCSDQREVDELWEKLSTGAQPGRCGWLKDRFGVSWQIVPTVLFDLLKQPDRAASGRVMQAMLKMNKLDIAALQAAASPS
ncbi:MAG: VOC family protein [Alphaproteobacteria bacterium]|nr:VOC family protein [Alphaproteobacteria bacterium]